MKMKFAASDFNPSNNKYFTSVDFSEAAELANEKLDAWLSDAIEVSGISSIDGVWAMSETICGKPKPEDTHRALLVNIEELPKEPTKEIYVESEILLNGERLYRKIIR